MLPDARQFALEGRLVLFVGAGVSSLPPTSLPSWWAMNSAVVESLVERVAELVGADQARTFGGAIMARHDANRFPPEYQAEVIFRNLGSSYFSVLQSLDSDTPNEVHLTIAALAKAGRVPVIVTTNFDRALEAACRQLEVPVEVWSSPGQFSAFTGDLPPAAAAGGCLLLKLHGSAEDPESLIDTLSQRKRGFAPQVAACLRYLLRFAHWLFLGYSGADLMAEENYLFLKPDAPQAKGFTWLVRTNAKPVPAVSELCAVFGSRAGIVYSELPEWLVEFSRPLVPHPALPAAPMTEQQIFEARRKSDEQVASHARKWAAAQRFDQTVLVFAALLKAVGEPASALGLLQKLYDAQPGGERRTGPFGVVVNALANACQEASRFDEAAAFFQEALEIFDPARDKEEYLGTLSNLALVYEKRGQTTEALGICQRALAFAEETHNDAFRSVALHNLAMIRGRLGEREEAERLYLSEIEIVRALGDEPARAIALNNLGELEVSRRRFASAVRYLEEAASVRDRLGDDRGAALARANLANAEYLQQNYDNALRLYGDCLEIFRRFSSRTEAAMTLANMARVKEDAGERDDALALIDQALAEAVAIGADPVRAQALRMLGEIRQKQGELQTAAGIFRELLELTTRTRDALLERDARVGLAIALKSVNALDPAIDSLRQALALTDRFGFPARDWVIDQLADALNLDGLARQQSGDFDGALKSLDESVAIWRFRESLSNEGQTLINVANTHVMRKSYGEAAAAFQQAADALLRAGERDQADRLSFTAADIYLQLGRFDDASPLFRAFVNRAGTYEERTDRMNRIGALGQKRLGSGAIHQTMRILHDCYEWNLQDGYPADAAACLLNIGEILKQIGDTEPARRYFEGAAAILEDQPGHPLLERARTAASTLSPDSQGQSGGE